MVSKRGVPPLLALSLYVYIYNSPFSLSFPLLLSLLSLSPFIALPPHSLSLSLFSFSPQQASPSIALSFLCLSAEESRDNIYVKKNVHSAPGAADSIFLH